MVDRAEDKYILGVSTGLAFKNLNLVEATKNSAAKGAQAVELCPNHNRISDYDIAELNKIKKGEGLVYTVHLPNSLRVLPSNTFDITSYKDVNLHAAELAQKVEASWIVGHLPRIAANPLNSLQVNEFLATASAMTSVPILWETGVYRRINGIMTEEEEGRSPERLKLYADEDRRIVMDVPKASRFRESKETGGKILTDLDEYVDRCFRLGLHISELQVVGTEEWSDDYIFAERALGLLKKYNYNDSLIIIESTQGRLDHLLQVVRDFLAL